MAVVGGAAVLGGAGALLGPAWAAAGLVAGPFLALAAAAVVQGFAAPDPADLLQAGEHREALRLVDEQPRSSRIVADHLSEIVQVTDTERLIGDRR